MFWIGAIVEDYLLGVGEYGSVLHKLYELSGDFKIARAKVLEIPEQGFGFKEIRNEYLRTGQSDWLSWSRLSVREILNQQRETIFLIISQKLSFLESL